MATCGARRSQTESQKSSWRLKAVPMGVAAARFLFPTLFPAIRSSRTSVAFTVRCAGRRVTLRVTRRVKSACV